MINNQNKIWAQFFNSCFIINVTVTFYLVIFISIYSFLKYLGTYTTASLFAHHQLPFYLVAIFIGFLTDVVLLISIKLYKDATLFGYINDKMRKIITLITSFINIIAWIILINFIRSIFAI